MRTTLDIAFTASRASAEITAPSDLCLALAVRRGRAIASFDTALPVTAVRGASRKHLLTV